MATDFYNSVQNWCIKRGNELREAFINGRLGIAIATIVTFVLGATVRGEWILILVHLVKQFGPEKNNTNTVAKDFSTLQEEAFNIPWLERHGFKDLYLYLGLSLTISFGIFYGIHGYLHWYFYIKRRLQSKEWKCQPDLFLTPENERHEIMLGSFNMFLGATASGFIACYIMNGGNSALYYNLSKHGWLYTLSTIPLLYLYSDGIAYYFHRAFHNPWLYKRVHKIHHRYKSPTAIAAVAMHPAEFLMYQFLLAIPMFTVPIHWAIYVGNLLYVYYYGMMDHSGIKMKAFWPWQPHSLFHDDHHKYFHCNFGFNSYLFDWLHGTLRKKDRIYNEEIFGGFGKILRSKKD